ncbi:MAG: hypothetical protein WAM28_01520 [Chlamydiales bacterium]
MYKLSILITLYFLCLNSIDAIEKVILVTGPESSGSKYITWVISKAVYQDRPRDHWGSDGLIWYSDGKTLIAHHSQPTLRPPLFRTLCELKNLLPQQCPIFFVIPTRDHSIVALSKQRRFNAKNQWGKGIEIQHEQISREILEEILLKEKAMVWSYETFIYLGNSYLKKLYEFLEITTDYFPNNTRDENAKYILK